MAAAMAGAAFAAPVQARAFSTSARRVGGASQGSSKVRASPLPSRVDRSPVWVALVAAGAALALHTAPVPLAHAGLVGANDAKVELGNASDVVRRKVEGAKDMLENAKRTADGGSAAAGQRVRSERARDVRSAAKATAESATRNLGLPNPVDAGNALTSTDSGQ